MADSNTRNVTFDLLARVHDETAGNLKRFQDAYQASYDAIDQIALSSIEKRHRAELDKLAELKKGSSSAFDGLAQMMQKATQESLEQMRAGHERMMAQMRADFASMSRTMSQPQSMPNMAAYGATGTSGYSPVSFQAQPASAGVGTTASNAKEVDQILRSVDNTLRTMNTSGDQFRVTVRGWLDDIAKMKDELKAADELKRRITQFQNDPAAMKVFQDELVTFHEQTMRKRLMDQKAAEERSRRDAMETKRARATMAGIGEYDPGYSQFMGLEDRQQETVIKARARLRDRVLKEERKQQEEQARVQQMQAAQEQDYLVKRESRWVSTEANILRSREVSAIKQNRINDQLTNQLLGLAGGTASFVRGFALLGIAGEENSQKLLEGLIKTQAGFDVIMGGIRLVVNANQAWETYQKALKLAGQEQQNEARAAQLAFEKSQALTNSLNLETDAATKLAHAHRGLADARNYSTGAGGHGAGGDGAMAAKRAVQAAQVTTVRSTGSAGYALAPAGTRVGMREALGLDDEDGYRLAPPMPRGARTIAGMAQVPADFDHSHSSFSRDQQSAEMQAYMDAIGRPNSAKQIRQLMSRGGMMGRNLAASGVAQGVGLDIATMTGSAVSGVTGSDVLGGFVGNTVVGAGTGIAAKAIGAAGAAVVPAFIAGGIAAGVGSAYSGGRAMSQYGYGGGADPGTYTAWMGDTYASSGAWMNRKLQGIGGIQGALTFGMGGPKDDFLGQLNQLSAGEATLQRMQESGDLSSQMRGRRESLAAATIQANRPLESLRLRREDFENDVATNQATNYQMASRRSEDRESQLRFQSLTEELRKLNEQGIGGGAQARGIDALVAELSRERREVAINRISEGSLREQVGVRNALESASQDRYRAQQDARQVQADLSANNGRGSQAALQDAKEREIAAQERIFALTERQRMLQLKMADEKRQATEEAIAGIQREIESRKAVIAQEKARVEAARERFGDMSEEQRRSVLDSKKRIDAEKSLVERFGMNSKQLREGQQSIMDYTGASQERMSLQKRIEEIEGNRVARAETPGQVVAARKNLDALTASSASPEEIKKAKAALEQARTAQFEAFKGPKATDEELGILKGQFSTAQDKEAKAREKAMAFQENRMYAGMQAGLDRKSISTLESKIRGGGELTEEERRTYDEASGRISSGVATGAQEADLRRVGSLGLREGEEMLRKRRQANADVGGFRSVSRDSASEMTERENANIAKKLEVELKDKREVVVRVEMDVDALSRQISTLAQPEYDRLLQKAAEMSASQIANSERNSTTAARGRAIGAGRG